MDYGLLNLENHNQLTRNPTKDWLNSIAYFKAGKTNPNLISISHIAYHAYCYLLKILKSFYELQHNLIWGCLSGRLVRIN